MTAPEMVPAPEEPVVPAWLADADADDQAALADALGLPLTAVTLDGQETDPGAIRATLSRLLTGIGRLAREEAAVQATWQAETALLHRHYSVQIERARARADRLRDYALALAKLHDVLPEGKKSVALAGGTIGKRQKPLGVKVTDAETFFAWAKALVAKAVQAGAPYPLLVREKVMEAPDLNAVKAYVAEFGEEPPGVEVIPPHDEWYFKPTEA